MKVGANIVDSLTVKEVAELKGCSERYIQKLISDNKIQAFEELNENNKIKYLVNVDDLPSDLRDKYYKKLNKTRQIYKVDDSKYEVVSSNIYKKSKYRGKTCNENLNYEDFSSSERCEIDFWIDILKQWLEKRELFDNKVMADDDIVGAINLNLKQKNIDKKVSVNTLYRKLYYYRQNDLSGLIDKRGGHNKGKSNIPSVVWDGFLSFYLDDRRPTFSDVYKTTIDWTKMYYPELVCNIPSEMTFRRHLKSDVPSAIIEYMRYGEKSVKDKCLPYIQRLYDDLNVNDVWITDNHTLDIQTRYDDRDGLHRLYITGFLDAKSGVLVGWNITDNPSINSTVFALRNAIIRTGTVPKIIYSDNGSEFMSYDFAGRGKRSQKKEKTIDYAMTILGRLGIEIKIAQVRNARAKPIERFFLDFKNHISKMIKSYTGGNVLERPESLKKRIKNDEIPIDSEIRKVIDEMVELENANNYGGSEKRYKGMSKIEVYNECVKDTIAVKISESELNLMLMRSETIQKVKRNGVKIRISGEDIWYSSDDSWLMYGKEVYVRYDPTNLATARIYDKDDRYIATWEVEKTLMLAFMESNIDSLSDANKKLAKITKTVKQYSKDMFANMSSETKIDMLDVKLRKIRDMKTSGKLVLDESNVISIRNSKDFIDERNKKVIQKTGTDNVIEIDIDRMNRNSLKSKMI